MNGADIEDLKCGDIIQCQKHKNIKGKSVEIAEFDPNGDKDGDSSICGCNRDAFKKVSQ